MTDTTQRREELLETAIALFAERGYVGTSIRDIAKAINRSVSNVYHYFENKEELWLAILEYSVKGLPEKLRQIAHGEGEPLERFQRLVRAHLEASTLHQRESKIFFIDEERLSPRGKEINRRIQKEILDIYVEQLRLLMSHKLVKTRNPKILAFNVLGTINWYLRWFDPSGGLAEDEIHQEIIEFILHGMCGRADSNNSGLPGEAS
ncbi:TetR/AcrR family transcriptional regulator [Kineobactrum salinum]|uniref:TetR/AcrR family transcriptional regulator n=1 Tax=Kineobactrum salinum TaxID=2708301 RepID=A0A6C0U3Q3_9GAMM|nr:TetR/AcrR family transcriptional regulator [Kineobactrum salinum]QIB66059.1 TetR/AcrR family transcriptional regulator [Kineobactrum salinum]